MNMNISNRYTLHQHQKKSKPILTDPMIIPRVKQYLEENVHQTYVDVSVMARDLQTKYREYERRKAAGFRLLVEQAYKTVLHSYGLDSNSTSDEEVGSDTEVANNSPNHLNNMLTNLYTNNSNKAMMPQATNLGELIDISSDEDIGDDPPATQTVEKNNINSVALGKAITITKVKNPERNYDTPSVMATTSNPNANKRNYIEAMNPDGRYPINDPKIAKYAAQLKKHKFNNKKTSTTANVIIPTIVQTQPTPTMSARLATGSNQYATKSIYSNNKQAIGVGGAIINKQNQKIGDGGNLEKVTLQQRGLTPKIFSAMAITPRKKNTKKEITIAMSDKKFSDIGGMDKILKNLCEQLLHINHPEIYRHIGLQPPRGFLLHGPPGCGKTLLARAIAGQLNVGLIEVAATELIGGVSGESEERIRDLFEQAAKLAPCVLFIDEIDAISSNRMNAQKDMERRIVAQLLNSLDNLQMSENGGDQILVIGATNRADSLDPSLRRVGRFDQEICLGIPDRHARAEILKILCRDLKLEENFDYDSVSVLTPGYVGGDLLALATRAASIAIKRLITTDDFLNCANFDDEADDEEDDDDIVITSAKESLGEIEDSSKLPSQNGIDSIKNINNGKTKTKDVDLQLINVDDDDDDDDLILSINDNPKSVIDTDDTTRGNDNIDDTVTIIDDDDKKDEEKKDETVEVDKATGDKKEDEKDASKKDDGKELDKSTDDENALQIDEDKINESSDVPNEEDKEKPDTVDNKDEIVADEEKMDTSEDVNENKTTDAIENDNKTEVDIIENDINTEADKIEGNEEDNKSIPTIKLHTLDDMLDWLKQKSIPISTDTLNKLFITHEDFIEAIKFVQPSAKREGFITVPDVTWNDVGSLHQIRQELQLAILAPIKYPEKLLAFGLQSPAGILLTGPPGCGKTLLAKAVANEAGINFISVKGPELLNMYVGESERAVRQCFERARNSAPCVIFFDEFDALCPTRNETGKDGGGSGVRVVNQLLTEMDGIEERKGIFLMAATNRPDMIDKAVLRPGRLGKTIYVGLPNERDRLEIINAITKNGTKPEFADDVDLQLFARQTRDYTGADLAGMIREASLYALQDSILESGDDHKVYNKHLLAAFKASKPSISKAELKQYAENYGRM